MAKVQLVIDGEDADDILATMRRLVDGDGRTATAPQETGDAPKQDIVRVPRAGKKSADKSPPAAEEVEQEREQDGPHDEGQKSLPVETITSGRNDAQDDVLTLHDVKTAGHVFNEDKGAAATKKVLNQFKDADGNPVGQFGKLREQDYAAVYKALSL